jgi:hypothetical protein
MDSLQLSGWLIKKNSKNDYHNRRFVITEGAFPQSQLQLLFGKLYLSQTLIPGASFVYYESGSTFSRGASGEPVGVNERGRVRFNNMKRLKPNEDITLQRRRWVLTCVFFNLARA